MPPQTTTTTFNFVFLANFSTVIRHQARSLKNDLFGTDKAQHFTAQLLFWSGDQWH